MSQNLAAIPCFILCKMILSEKLDFILSVSHNTKIMDKWGIDGDKNVVPSYERT